MTDKFLNSKQNVRKQMREKRQCLSEQDRASASLSVLAQLKKYHCFQLARRTALYLENDGELSLAAVVDDILRRRKECFLPVVLDHPRRKLNFATYKKETPLHLNRYNIPEPNIPIKKQTKPMCLNLVLMPLVAFDHNGNRLGMGGGYYDRGFAFLKRRKHWGKPRLIGVAYDFQEVKALQHEAWDIPLDAVVTPTRLIKFNPNIS